jgi:hypothetical protein
VGLLPEFIARRLGLVNGGKVVAGVDAKQMTMNKEKGDNINCCGGGGCGITMENNDDNWYGRSGAYYRPRHYQRAGSSLLNLQPSGAIPVMPSNLHT